MQPEIALSFARHAHAGQLSRSGEPLIDHVERVGAALPAGARAIGYLHDVLEWSDACVGDLRRQGLTDAELSVIKLLTRDPSESYETHVKRIARARGVGGRLARAVKLADLEDHLARRVGPGAPNYAWARDLIGTAQRRPGRRRRAASRAPAAFESPA